MAVLLEAELQFLANHVASLVSTPASLQVRGDCLCKRPGPPGRHFSGCVLLKYMSTLGIRARSQVSQARMDSRLVPVLPCLSFHLCNREIKHEAV
jgi:hypothetical protein